MAEVWTMGEALVEIMRPEENMPLDEPTFFKGPFPSGSSSIMISSVARLGHSAGIISGVGKDEFGDCIINRLKKDGVDVTKMLIDPDHPTACAFVAYSGNGDRRFLFHWAETPATEAKAPDVTEPALKEAKYFHVMGCALTAKLSYGWEIVKTVKAMKAQGTKISFDPNVRLELMTNQKKNQECYDIINEILAETSVFEPGFDELKLLTGEENVSKAVQKCFRNPNLDILLLKMGSRGSRIYTRDGEIVEQGLYKVKCVDPTGAGDASDAAFICGLLEKKPITECAEMAAAAGALNVEAFGPMEGKISRENIRALIQGSYQS